MQTQETLTDETDAETMTCRIETNARIARPMLKPPLTVDDEFKLRADSDGLHVTCVDPANVFMLEQTVHPRAFDTYQLTDPDGDGELLHGARMNRVARALSDASMNITDPDSVRFEITDRELTTTIMRDYDGPTGNTRMNYSKTVKGVDPDSVREEPEVPDIDEHLHGRARIPPEMFRDVIQKVDKTSDHVRFAAVDGRLKVSAKGDREDDMVDCGPLTDDCAAYTDDEIADSLFSVDYVRDLATALGPGAGGAKATHLRLRWGDEFPIKVDYARHAEDDDGGYADEPLYSGTAMLAPRIQSETHTVGE